MAPFVFALGPLAHSPLHFQLIYTPFFGMFQLS